MSLADGSRIREEGMEDDEIISQSEDPVETRRLAGTKPRGWPSFSRSNYDADSSGSKSYVEERQEKYPDDREPPCKISRSVSDHRFE